MAETLISLAELVGEEKLRALVEEVSHLSASSIWYWMPVVRCLQKQPNGL